MAHFYQFGSFKLEAMFLRGQFFTQLELGIINVTVDQMKYMSIINQYFLGFEVRSKSNWGNRAETSFHT